MRKWVAVGCTVLALGAIWTGTAWYTGKQLESGMAQLAESADAQARLIGAKLGETLSFEQLSYERGVFTSQARYRLKAQPLAKDGPGATGRDYEIVVRLDHGPFPRYRLLQGHLFPAMAAARAELAPTPSLETWFAAAQGGVPMTAEAVAGYGRDIAASLALAPVERARDESRFSFSGLTLQTDVAAGGKHTVVTIRSDRADLFEPFIKDGANHTRRLAMRDLAIRYDATRASDETGVATTCATLKQWTVEIDGEPVTLRDVAVNLDASGADSAMQGKLAVQVAGIDTRAGQVANLRLAAEAHNLDLVSFRGFRDTMEATKDGGSMSDKMVGAGHVMKFLLAEPGFSLAPLQIDTANGSATLQLAVGLAAPTLWNHSPAAVVKETVRKFDARLSVPVASVADLIAVRLQADGMAEAAARDAARRQADGVRDRIVGSQWGAWKTASCWRA
ncbi:YdgA family protein [Achromobacter dolens]|uniref:YdgA family protein n=1 Tax=Achromobacter dolens TaxID=1287738 RepID=UPI003BA1B0A0